MPGGEGLLAVDVGGVSKALRPWVPGQVMGTPLLYTKEGFEMQFD